MNNKMEYTPNYKTVEFFPDGRMDIINAAKYLGLSKSRLDSMRSEGRGPKFVKPGGVNRIFYFKEDLDVWILSEYEQEG